MHKSESLQENETHQILGDVEIQMNHTILVRKPDLVLIKKKEGLVILWVLLFQLTIEWKWKKAKKIDKYFNLARELKKTGKWGWQWY